MSQAGVLWPDTVAILINLDPENLNNLNNDNTPHPINTGLRFRSGGLHPQKNLSIVGVSAQQQDEMLVKNNRFLLLIFFWFD